MDNNNESFNQYLQDFNNWLESINNDFLSNNNNNTEYYNNRNKLYTSNKYKDELTSYALHCGYAQTRNNKTLTVVHKLYKVASLYEIKYFETIKEARKYLYYS